MPVLQRRLQAREVIWQCTRAATLHRKTSARVQDAQIAVRIACIAALPSSLKFEFGSLGSAGDFRRLTGEPHDFLRHASDKQQTPVHACSTSCPQTVQGCVSAKHFCWCRVYAQSHLQYTHTAFHGCSPVQTGRSRLGSLSCQQSTLHRSYIGVLDLIVPVASASQAQHHNVSSGASARLISLLDVCP